MAEFMLSVHHGVDDALEPGVDMAEVFAAVEKFNTELRDSGAWVFAGGLMPAATAKVVTADGAITVKTALDGPAQLGGFWVINVPSEADAVEWARKAAETRCARAIEVRPFQGE